MAGLMGGTPSAQALPRLALGAMLLAQVSDPVSPPTTRRGLWGELGAPLGMETNRL